LRSENRLYILGGGSAGWRTRRSRSSHGTFEVLDARVGRLSPPTERPLLERPRDNSGTSPQRPPADFVYTKNRERLLFQDVMGAFLEKLMGSPEVTPPLREETANDGITTGHEGVAKSFHSRRGIEKIFGLDRAAGFSEGAGTQRNAPVQAVRQRKCQGRV